MNRSDRTPRIVASRLLLSTQLLAMLFGLSVATVKATPESPLPSGPNIEPLPDRSPPPFMVPKGVTNVAASRTVTGSAPPFSGRLSQLTDGKKEALDFDCVEMKKGLQWVQVDLGQSYAIYAIVLWHDHRYTQLMYDVIVQVADDPEFQKGVTTLFNNDRDNSAKLGVGTDLEYFETCYGRVIDGKGIKARHVRSYTNGSSLIPLNCWQELEVYGSATDPRNVVAVGLTTNSLANSMEPLKLRLPAPAPK